MRKRQIKKNFFIDEHEDKILKKKIEKAKITESDYFRNLILDKDVKEKPGLEFYNYLNDIRGMATNLNQLTKLAHINGEINVERYESLKKEIEDFIIDIKEQFLNIDKKKK